MTSGPIVAASSWPAIDIAGRRAQIDAALGGAGIDALVVTSPTNIAWATGFTGSFGVLVVAVDGWVLYTDSRYALEAPDRLAASGVDAEVVVGSDPWPTLAARAAAGRVGVEADHITWQQVRPLLEGAGDERVVPTTEVIDALRATKQPGELARMRTAAAIADAALGEVAPQLVPGVSELAIAAALDDALRSGGAAGPAYETIVASGPNSALPHARPSHRVIDDGDLVVIDVGALVDGYRSDMTRTFVVGEPSADQRHHLEVVAAAQQAGLAAVAPGATAAEVDGAARSVIVDAGWGDAFGHGTGHGVGLDIHELPRVNSRSDTVLEPTMVLTVEPGVYLPGVGGVRWEDLVVVTDHAGESLTRSPKPQSGAGDEPR